MSTLSYIFYSAFLPPPNAQPPISHLTVSETTILLLPEHLLLSGYLVTGDLPFPPRRVSLSFLILLRRTCSLFGTKGGAWLFKTGVQALLIKLKRNKRSNSTAMDKISSQIEEFVHKYF